MIYQATQFNRDGQQLLFLPGIFNEALGLLFEAQEYFQTRGMEDQATITANFRLQYANEMGRITLRLTSVMAWLMVRRAVYSGRIDEEKAQSAYRLEAQDVCLIHNKSILENLPYYLSYLSDRSLGIYERIQRLDTMAYEPKSLPH